MDLETVMKQMEAEQEKVAQATPAQAPAPNEANALAHALEKAATAVPQAPSNGGDAVAALQSVAEKLAEQEREADIAHANLCGQAFADGAINKFAAYDAMAKMAAAQQPQIEAIPGGYSQKEAQVQDVDDLDFDTMLKVAAAQGDDETLVKVAAEQGYTETMVKVAAEQGYADTMEKAAADYNAGAEHALSEVHSLASGEFLKGAAETEMLINHWRAQQ